MEDLKTRNIDPDVAQLVKLLSFLDPHFKLAHFTDKDDILKEIEKHMMMGLKYLPLKAPLWLLKDVKCSQLQMDDLMLAPCCLVLSTLPLH